MNVPRQDGQPTPTDREAAVPPATGEAAHKVWFICGAWTIREQGPILNFERPYKRAQYVYRCDKEDGHDGDHVDSVLGANWRGPTPDEAATSAPAPVGDVEQAELPPVDEQCNRELKDRYENAAPKTTVWCLLSCRERQLRAERAAHKATREELTVTPEQLSEKLTHGRNCPAWTNSAGHEVNEGECTCGLRFRIAVQTEQNLRAAWMKRANEAEAENQELRRKVEDAVAVLDNYSIYANKHAGEHPHILRDKLRALLTAKEGQ